MENCVFLANEKLSLGGDTPRVLARLCMPQLTANAPAPFAKNFASYYSAMGEGFKQYLNGKLVAMAEAEANNEGFKPYGGVLNCTVSYEGKLLVSLYTDAIVSMGNKKHLHRIAKLWRKDTGVLLRSSQVFRQGAVKKLVSLLSDSVEEWENQTGTPLYSDFAKQLKGHFSLDNYYFSPKGVVFFYQAGVISALQKPIPLFLPMEAVEPYFKDSFLQFMEEE